MSPSDTDETGDAGRHDELTSMTRGAPDPAQLATGQSIVSVRSAPVQSHSITTSERDAHNKRELTDSAAIRDDLTRMMLERCKALQSKTIDLGNRGLKKIPAELLELKHLENLYLEGNNLVCLPENFFDALPNLKWLDLRRNYLVALPNTYIGRHANLKTLLLEGNELRSLPLELGLVGTITGLNISNNPLEFPPQEVIEKGVRDILLYLREMLLTKTQGRTPLTDDQDAESSPTTAQVSDLNKLAELSIRDGNDTSSDMSSDDDYTRHRDVQNYGYEKQDVRSLNNDDRLFLCSERSVGPIPVHSAALHKPVSYYQIKQQHLERVKKAGGLGKLEKSKSLSGGSRRRSSKKLKEVCRFPAPPSMELIEHRALEEKRLKKLREVKEKQDMVLQRRKDAEMLKNFQTETRRMQQKKYYQRLQKGEDYKEPVITAPFGIEDEHLKMPTNEQRIKQDVKSAHEKVRRHMSPRSRLRLEEARQNRDRELEHKIKMHTQEIMDRRRKPKADPREDMAAAKRDMEIVRMLRAELMRRCDDVHHLPNKI